MSLVIVGPSRWPERIRLLPTPSPRALSPKPNGVLLNSPSFRRNHERKGSRPFDVLYEDVHKDNKPPKLAGDLNAQYMTVTSPSYIRIENTLRTGNDIKATSAGTFAPPPIVTFLDGKGPGRSSSISSRQANLRRRHSQRNWIARKSDVVPKRSNVSLTRSLKSELKARSKIDYIFPIRRKTTFAFNLPLSPKPSKFRSQEDIDDFFAIDDVSAAIKSLLPEVMNTYYFKKLTRVEPLLKIVPQLFDIAKNETFLSAAANGPLNQPPLEVQNSSYHPDSLLESPTSNDANEKNLLLASLYEGYRLFCFGSKGVFPKKIGLVFPFECDKISEREKEQLSTTLLLEILLRRTVASKIEFRLKQNNLVNQGPYSSSNDSSSVSDISEARFSISSSQ